MARNPKKSDNFLRRILALIKRNLKYLRLFLFIISAYVGLYHITSNRYEQQISRLTHRVSSVISQLEGENWKAALMQIPKLQNTKVPVAPDIMNPIKTVSSLFNAFNTTDPNSFDVLQNALNRKKGELSEVMLYDAVFTHNKDRHLLNLHQYDFSNSNFKHSIINDSILSKLDLSNSNFKGTNLNGSSLENSILTGSNFTGAKIEKVNLRNSILLNVSMKDSQIADSNMSRAYLINANFGNATITNTNFENANLLGADLSTLRNFDNNTQFQNALYNSKEINFQELKGIEISYRKRIKKICSALDEKTKEECINLYISTFNLLSSLDGKEIPATKFPKGFKPKGYKMIDYSELLKEHD